MPFGFTTDAPGDQNTLGHGFEPQVEVDVTAGRDRDHVQPDARGRGDGTMHLLHRTGTSSETANVQTERAGGGAIVAG